MKEKNPESLSTTNETKSEILASDNQQDIDQIKALEKSVFDWEVEEEDLEALVDKIKSPSSLTLVLRDEEKNIVGYLVMIPSEEVDDEIKTEDPGFETSSSKAYVETLAIDRAHRGSISQIKGLFSKLADEAKAHDYEVITAHVPVEHLPLYERFSDAEVLRTIENWFDSGEDHHYIEIKL